MKQYTKSIELWNNLSCYPHLFSFGKSWWEMLFLNLLTFFAFWNFWKIQEQFETLATSKFTERNYWDLFLFSGFMTGAYVPTTTLVDLVRNLRKWLLKMLEQATETHTCRLICYKLLYSIIIKMFTIKHVTLILTNATSWRHLAGFTLTSWMLIPYGYLFLACSTAGSSHTEACTYTVFTTHKCQLPLKWAIVVMQGVQEFAEQK